MVKIRLLLSFSLLTGLTLQAEEGLWLLSQLDQLDLKAQGLEIDLADLYDPDNPSITDAVVWLGGCTASFVSSDGLLVTNHHCAYGSLQRASTPEQDYLKNGFLARDRSEEIQAPGARAYTLQEMRDVTKKVLKGYRKIEDLVEKEKKIAARIESMTTAIEGDREDIAARIVSMYNGKQYILFVQQRYDDVRLVYAPPSSIGKYGGDIDNWMWPRHTGDYAFYRVYTAPDGSGADYNPENVPVKPKSHLKIARTYLKEGDFTFILGYPGGTQRYRTSNSVDWNLHKTYPNSIQNYSEIVELMEATTQDSPEGQLKLEAFKSGLNNVIKNYQGQIDGMTGSNFLQRKRDFEAEFMTFVNSQRKTRKTYGTILEEIEELYLKLEETQGKDDVLSLFGRLAGTLNSIARQAYRVAQERAKPAEEREPGYTDKDIKESVDRLKYSYQSYYEPFDQALLKRALGKAAALPEGSRIRGLEPILAGSIDEYVEQAYHTSRVGDLEYAQELFNKAVAELEALQDPLIHLQAALYPELEDRRKAGKEFGAQITDLRKNYIDALFAWKGQKLYPDANGTMRLTYGRVAGYQPADAVTYAPFTTFSGVVEKDTGLEPFDMPPQLREIYLKKDYGPWLDQDLGDVPVCFTHKCDITGGNSGSPVMNSKGELVGLAFDGNYEAMTSDWQYDDQIQRAISVDIHYVLFLAEKFSGAQNVVEEMGF